MKKFKKMLAGLLGAAMVLTSFGTPTWAEGEVATPQKTTATIDTTKTGSITIHKYEYNGNEEIPGTGEETDKLPTDDKDMKALKGVGFTIYKVANESDLTNYYKADPADLPSVDKYVDKTSGKIKSEYAGSKVGEEGKTDDDGVVKFTGLELGFYVVVETTTPAKVTTPVKPFIVSVPMTTNDGDNWLYDVHVYPKNQTTYGKVTLEKQGNKDTEKLEGVTFVLQKKNGTSWESVTTNDSTGAEYDLTTNKSGQINVEGLSQGTYRFIEIGVGNNDGYIMDGATVYEFIVTSEGKITYDGKTDNNTTIPVKNEKPDMTKQVKERDKDNWKQDADYNVGDMVPYKITIDVPSNITKLKEFTLTDTPKNLEDDLASVVVKCGETTLTKGNDYAIDKDATNGKGFKITFTTANMKSYASKQIVVTYNAKLLDSAVTTIEGNPNKAKLEYSNKILPDTEDVSNPNKPGVPGKDAIKDTATVYTFKLSIDKRAGNKDGEKLAGVIFDLYKEVPKGTEGAASAEEVNNAGLAGTKTWMKIEENLTTDISGTVEKSGLANGTYYLVETKTVDGYNLLKAPVEVKLDILYKTTTNKEYVIDENGVKTLVKNEIEKTTFTENEADSTGIHTETIINKQGFELPKTGDIGTAMFLIIGIGGMLAAVYIMLRGRKRA